MYQALYRKWRPQRFSEVVGQHYTVKTLQNALIQGKISHAYLFSGPRGIGKTSVARIFAKALNCPQRKGGEPCNECPSCQRITHGSALDVIEIDGASNRGIDQIRQLREEVNFAPAEGRYKVYIIDEVHMLTHEAFNALLKTLEEPPSHVIFIFATTEPHKVPPTVLSRCQAFEFKNIPQERITSQLAQISKAEGFQAEDEALSAIARYARGSLRDALVLLEQLVSYKGQKAIKAQDLQEMLGLPPQEVLDAFLRALITGDGSQALKIISDLEERGRDLELFLEELLHRSRDLLLDVLNSKTQGIPGSVSDWLRLTSQLLELKRGMRYVLEKRMFLEVKVLEIAESSSKSLELSQAPESPRASPTKTKKKAASSEPAPATSRQGKDRWQELLERTKKERIALHALLAEAQVREQENTLIIEYPKDYNFHKERLEQAENLRFVKTLVREIYGDVQLVIGFSQDRPQEARPKAEVLREKAELVRRTFGGKRLE